MASLGEIENSNITFLTIIAGKIAQKVDPTTPGAVEREYEVTDKTTKEKVKKTKFEKIYKNIKGKITGLEFKDSDYGKQLQIKLDDDMKLTLSTEGNYFSDFGHKLPNIDLSKDVTFAPYSFEDDYGKLRKGITITQDGNKLTKYYYNPETKETIGGYPTVNKEESKDYDKDDRKIYFVGVKKFFIVEIEKTALKLQTMLEKAEVESETGGEDDFSFMDETPVEESKKIDTKTDDLPF